MRDKYILTAESVTEGHPDKLCDTIADSVLDACLKGDSYAHVACEVLATAGKVLVAGEISAKVMLDIPSIACRTIREAGYTGLDYEIEVITHDQSDDIAYAVREGVQTGAGDQGIMYGFACDETESYLPLPVILAHRLTRLLTNARKTGMIQGLRPDGKAQVSVEYNFDIPVRLASVVLSCQHDPEKDLDKIYRIPGGGFIQKKDHKHFHEVLDRHNAEMEAAKAADEDGTGFLYQMFKYELDNHEYGYTGELEDTLDCLGLTWEELKASPVMLKALDKASTEIREREGC